ncbi:enoyl-CoA hydratase-related protein [Bacillus sp. EB600]|uniref:enoyl-CoA hydratase-related protein n=1 Tax=Bacillus sp. EB600 TaxID=2806345 RepID=UPI00210C72C2|nr:enoyl-CoA hydratase-related protein [Bacillus sp. EB600]MCQ6279633.1 enoyl-CoA hydratase/isomerase family protein [Bacillus sp. EB600]
MREFNTIECTVAENVAVITINRSKFLNALNTEVLTELSEAIDLIDKDSTVRAVIVTGAGEKAFVAGADISEMQNKDVLEAREFSSLGNKIFSKLENLKKPVIAAVNGFALGGGCELAMACDIRIAGNRAKFGQPEVGLGIMAGFGGSQRLARLVGAGIAKEILFTGEIINAERAYEIGLVNRIVDTSEVLEEANKLAKTIASKSPLGVCFSKKAVNEGINLDLERALSLEAELFGTLFSTKDQSEGMSAFLEKREPSFKGE